MIALNLLSKKNKISNKNTNTNTSTNTSTSTSTSTNTNANTNANTNVNTSATVDNSMPEALIKGATDIIKNQTAINNINKLLKNKNSFSLNTFGQTKLIVIPFFLYALVVLSILVNEANKVRNAKKDLKTKRKSAYLMATRITVLTFCIFASFFLVKKYIQKTEANIYVYLGLFLLNLVIYYVIILTAKQKNFRIFMYFIIWCMSLATKIALPYI